MTVQDGQAVPETVKAPSRRMAENAFSLAIIVSAIRCTFTYVLLPFVTPLIGLAPGVGPVLGLSLGVVAVTANVVSIRRFRRSNHRLRTPMTVIHVGVITLLAILMYIDLKAMF